MKSRRALLPALAVLGFCLAALPALSQVPTPKPRPAHDPVTAVAPKAPSATPGATAAAPAAPVRQVAHGRIVILRGLANIWSRGMDALADKLAARGVPSILKNHAQWRLVANQLITEYHANPESVEPIIIMGHSLGGGAALIMANYLGLKGVPVRLVVIFDAVGDLQPALATIEEIVNYYKPQGSRGPKVEPGRGFTGTIDNIDLTQRQDIGHVTIDKDEGLHADAITKVMQIYGLPPAGI